MSQSAPKFGLMVVMIITSILAMAYQPTHKIADDGPVVNLETMIPKQFGDWQKVSQEAMQIINPQQKEVLEKIYTQTLSRSYINANGDRVMLSIAYGADQSDAKQLHYPEVCYPAQGFQVLSNRAGILKTDFGTIKVKRLIAVIGNRVEPLTYWTTVGNTVVAGNKVAKITQLKYGLKGEIPDGLVFRVSSISDSPKQAFELQHNFISELFKRLPTEDRTKLAGLG